MLNLDEIERREEHDEAQRRVQEQRQEIGQRERSRSEERTTM